MTTGRLALLVATALSAGCAAGGGGGAPASADASRDATKAVRDSQAEPAQGGAPVIDTSNARPIAIVTGGNPAVLRGEILDFRRTGGQVVNLTFALVNEGQEGYRPEFGNGSVDYSVGGVYLIDEANGKRHLVLLDSDEDCLCTSTSGMPTIQPGERSLFSAQFAAPPPSVTTMTIVIPHHDRCAERAVVLTGAASGLKPGLGLSRGPGTRGPLA